jgi:DNA polymerase-3 subunit gamma/tau
MLTREASNALLKTLEEPPAHVVFVLCTTEPHKLPDTVLSRCQRFDFRRGSVELIADNLARICAQEGIAIVPEALDFVARRAAGSFRDAVSLLDQLAAYGSATISLAQVQQILGTVPTALVTALLRSLVAGQVADGLRAIDQALDQGAEPTQFLADILDQLRALMLIKIGGAEGLSRYPEETLADLRALAAQPSCTLTAIVRAIKLFNDAGRGLRTAVRPQLPLELALVEAALSLSADEPSSASSAQPPAGPKAVAAPAPARTATTAPPVATAAGQAPDAQRAARSEPPRVTYAAGAAPSTAQAVAEQPSSPAQAQASPALTLDWVRGKWRQIVTKLRVLDPSVQSLINSARPLAVHDNVVRLGCSKWVCDKLVDPKRRELVERVLSEALGAPTLIECVVSEQPADSEAPGEPEPPPSDLFAAPARSATPEEQLLNHPAVKELQKRGGKVTSISVKDKQEDERGQ